MIVAPPLPETRTARLRWAVTDGLTLVGRQLTQLRHHLSVLVVALIFPAAMVLLFGYVLGSAVPVPGGGDYREYLMPGLFVMVAFTGVGSNATDVAADAARGIMDRLRAMPVSRAAVPFGQTGADVVIGTVGLLAMALCGFAVGWRPHEGTGSTLAGVGLLILLRYAMSWVGVLIGLAAGSEDMAGRLVPFFFPLTLISNAFVPTDDMPGWLRAVADWNPVSAGVTAARTLFGAPGTVPRDAPWPIHHPVTASLAWSIALLVVFIPLTIRVYGRQGR